MQKHVTTDGVFHRRVHIERPCPEMAKKSPRSCCGSEFTSPASDDDEYHWTRVLPHALAVEPVLVHLPR